MEQFKDKFDDIAAYIEGKGLTVAFDNMIGLVNLDKMVDVMVQTPELRAEIHRFIREFMTRMLEFEYPDEIDESVLGYA